MIKIKKLKCNSILNQLIMNIKDDVKLFNFETTLLDLNHRYYITQDTISIIIFSHSTSLIRLDYSTSLNFASIFKYVYLITRDLEHLNIFESQIRKLLN